MTNEEMWHAIISNDASYDGIFFYAVKTTHIFCRPSCQSKQPKQENVCFFETVQQAIRAGFRPCKRCRSDLLAYQPMKEIAQQVKQRIDDAIQNNVDQRKELDQLGVSKRRMTEIFNEEYGMSVVEYVNQQRLDQAKHRLATTNDRIIDIAYAVGFGGLSTFYRFFKERTQQTPARYRLENKV